jgi:hypothetical protein
MRQLTASQKIATLENRVAQLEKQAIVQTIKNLGGNIIKPLSTVAKDIISTLMSISKKNKSRYFESASANLEARINRALEKNLLFGGSASVTVLSFNEKNPIESLLEAEFFVNGEKITKKFKISEVEKIVEKSEVMGKDIMGSYISWWKDWESGLKVVITGKVDKNAIEITMGTIKKYSKFLYRILTAFIKLSSLISIFKLLPKTIVMIVTTLSQGPLGFLYLPAVLFLDEAVDFLNTGAGIGITSLVAKVVDMILKSIEGAFRRRKVNIDKFNELIGKQASVNKYASKYPHTYSMLLRLESAGI